MGLVVKVWMLVVRWPMGLEAPLLGLRWSWSVEVVWVWMHVGTKKKLRAECGDGGQGLDAGRTLQQGLGLYL